MPRNHYVDPVMGQCCLCHRQPMVFRGGHLRCAVMFAALQHRYQVSDKGRLRNNRHQPTRRNRRVHLNRDYSFYMPTVELAEQARDLVKRRRSEFIARLETRAETESTPQNAVQA